MAADPDEELVARARSGSLEAFGSLVERHRDVVYRVAARIVGAHNAADVSQDAFLRAFNRLYRFRGEGPFRAWLLQITHNAALREAGLRRPEPVDLEQDSVGDPSRPARTAPRRRRSSDASGASASSARSRCSARTTAPCSSCATSRDSATRTSRRSPSSRWEA